MFDRTLIVRLLCVALVAAVMLPAGHVLFYRGRYESLEEAERER